MKISEMILILDELSKKDKVTLSMKDKAAIVLGVEALLRLRENRGKDLDPKNRNLPGEND